MILIQMDVSQILGRAKSITVSKDDSIIMEGYGSREEVEERASSIRNAIEITKSDYEKEKLQERLAKLTGGVAVIKVQFFMVARIGMIMKYYWFIYDRAPRNLVYLVLVFTPSSL